MNTSSGGLSGGAVTPITPHNKGLYEAGKKLLTDSVDAGRAFCESMITTSLSAVPVYLALLTLALPDKYRPSIGEGILIGSPAVAFLAATIVFVAGFFPQNTVFSLDLPQEIENARLAFIRRRKKAAVYGFALFGLAVLGAIVMTGYALTRATGVLPTAPS